MAGLSMNLRLHRLSPRSRCKVPIETGSIPIYNGSMTIGHQKGGRRVC